MHKICTGTNCILVITNFSGGRVSMASTMLMSIILCLKVPIVVMKKMPSLLTSESLFSV